MNRTSSAAQFSKTGAAALANATRGRARVFSGRRHSGPSVDEGLAEWLEGKAACSERPCDHGEGDEGDA